MMKSKFSAIFFLLMAVISGCTTKIYPIKGNYPQSPIIIKSEKPFEEVWGRLIDLFAQKGLSIQVIDKSSGLITSGKTVIPTAYEQGNGKISDSTAWIVVNSYKPSGQNSGRTPTTGTLSGVYAKKIIPYDAAGDWNVRLKADGSGTLINVNITNIEARQATARNHYNVAIDYKSTGVFEKMIYEYIK